MQFYIRCGVITLLRVRPDRPGFTSTRNVSLSFKDFALSRRNSAVKKAMFCQCTLPSKKNYSSTEGFSSEKVSFLSKELPQAHPVKTRMRSAFLRDTP